MSQSNIDKLNDMLYQRHNQNVSNLFHDQLRLANDIQFKRNRLDEFTKHVSASDPILHELCDTTSKEIALLETKLIETNNDINSLKPTEYRSDSKLAQCLIAHGSIEDTAMFSNVVYEMERAQNLYRLHAMSDSVCTPKMKKVASELHEMYPHVPWSVLWSRIRSSIHPILKLEALKKLKKTTSKCP